MVETYVPVKSRLQLIHRKKLRIPNFGYFRVFKEYPRKSQIWESETNTNQGIPNQVPKLGFVSLSQIWDFCGYSLNALKYPKLGICYFFLCNIPPPPGKPPGHLNFWKIFVQIPPSQMKTSLFRTCSLQHCGQSKV